MAIYDPSGIVDLMSQIEGQLELIVDQAAVDQVRKQLHEAARSVAASRFNDLHVAPGAFGGNSAAHDLGTHHQLAQDVVKETLTGLVKDLTKFGTNLDVAEQLIKDADDGSAGDLTRKRAAAILQSAASSDEAARSNHAARNHYLRGQGGASS